jgi:hypothetical protein
MISFKFLKPFVTFLFAIILLSSCSHKISRVDYALKKSEHTLCDIPIKKIVSVDASQGEKIGEIKLKDSGFSVACNESKAIEILKGEACALGANLIVITEEIKPSFSSSCYRCTAFFYRLNSDQPENIQLQESDISEYELHERSIEDKKKNRRTFWTSFAIGFVIGFIAVL